VARIEIPWRHFQHDPTLLEAVVGAVRIVLVLIVAGVGSILVLLAALVPGRIDGARPAGWINCFLARAFNVVCGVKLVGATSKQIRRHRGMVFINHLTYVDAVTMFARGPVRFVAAMGVKRIPFIGPISMAVETVFVNRGDRASRAESRHRIRDKLRARPAPPVTLAPEGQIGPGTGILPFRRGGFEIAVVAGLPIMPLVIHYEPFEAVAWNHGEPLIKALWRLNARRGGVVGTLTALPLLQPRPAETDEEVRIEAGRLAAEAEEMFARVVGRAPVEGSMETGFRLVEPAMSDER
jgi:1-acyl-sn-glycerol-3-phosphate acyltransferase